MKRVFCLFAVVALSLGCETGPASAADPGAGDDTVEFSMDEYEWSHRPLVVFSTDSEHRELRERIGAAWSDFVDRDMVLVWVEGERVEVRDGSKKAIFGSSAAESLRRDFRIEAHSVFLVGKDGGVKSQGDATVELARIFELIDSMPMRQQEMSERED